MASRRLVAWGGLGVALAAFGLLAEGERVLEMASRVDAALRGRSYRGLRCEYRETTGRPCVGCGGTSALRLARGGRLVESARANAFGFAVAGGLFVLTLGAALAAALRKPFVLLTALMVAGSTVVVGFAVQFVRWSLGGGL